MHADEEMDEDNLTIFDVERTVISGEIAERQRDNETGEWKFIVKGSTIDHRQAVVVTKLGRTAKAIIITVFEDESAIDGHL
ncbi:MAG: DUF4258 domain-containing protein [Methylococcales bacterium]